MFRLRQISLVAILFCALSHAWVGHDYFHGHHHDELQEAAYSTSWKGQADQLSSTALTTKVLLWNHLSDRGLWIATCEDLDTSFQAPHFLDAKQVPRPPPRFSFVA
jgi:hypothetical protein